LVIRRAELERFSYEDRGWPEDYDLVLRLLRAGRRIGVVPRRLLGWRHHATRQSLQSPRCAIASIVRCKAAHLASGFLEEGDRYVLWGFGGTGKALRRALAAHGKHPAAIVELHPGRLGNRIHGAPVVPPDHLAGAAPLPIVVSVAGLAARSEIRACLGALGFRESRDFVCAA
jgi:hypothetical protein